MGRIIFNEEIYVVEKLNSTTDFFVFVDSLEYSFTYRDGIFITNNLPEKYREAVEGKIKQVKSIRDIKFYEDGTKGAKDSLI